MEKNMKTTRMRQGFTLIELLGTRSSLRAQPLRGFTLIELLLVMVILAVLAALVLPKFTGRT